MEVSGCEVNSKNDSGGIKREINILRTAHRPKDTVQSVGLGGPGSKSRPYYFVNL